VVRRRQQQQKIHWQTKTKINIKKKDSIGSSKKIEKFVDVRSVFFCACKSATTTPNFPPFVVSMVNSV